MFKIGGLSLLIFFIISNIWFVSARPNDKIEQKLNSNKQPKTCGYDSCHPTKNDAINVHIVPHTHDDVGWLKTVDQYYYGSRNNIQKAGVQYILDSVVDELIRDPNRRFVYVESAFFEKWWSKQSDSRRHHVKRLVAEGRLEFAGGGWTMNDEAAAHYHSIIDQLTWGLRFLNDTFGECGRPKAGWQIDPFGHSREFANILSLSGFDGLLLGRIDYQDRRERSKNKNLETLWKGNDDLGAASNILTGIMYNTYSPPPGFCFDVLCSDEPIIDDPTIPDYNVDKMVKKFVEYVNNATKVYKTNNVIITMGGDFTYQDALMWYKNLDKLIKYVNEREKSLNLIYSTPSCYIKSLFDSNAMWNVMTDDFFPYASDEHAFWTGYFTSRPTQKYYERKGNNFLQICKQLYAMTNLNERDKVDLNMLRTAMGIMQHHDAITGTEKQHVANDYARMLENGIQDCLLIVEEAMNKLLPHPDEVRSKNGSYMPLTLCHLNISECVITETNDQFIVTIYNPLGHEVHQAYLRFPAIDKKYMITDMNGYKLPYDVIPISQNTLSQLNFRNSNTTKEILFKIENLPPLGYTSLYVETTENPDNMNDQSAAKTHKSPHPKKYKNVHKSNDKKLLSIGNDIIKVHFDENTGYMDSVTIIGNNKNNITIPMKQEILFYEGMIGNNSISTNRASGAYIFRPKTQEPSLITNTVETKVIKASLVEEVHQKFSDWASQVIRVYRDEYYIEFEWLIGPIPVDDKKGKEIVSRFTTDINNNGVFYTDSNGRQMLKRVLNTRPNWNLDLAEPVAGNYYPVTSMIYIKDNATNNSIHVLTDRAQGGSSLKNGQIELMIHRRLLHDDAFGVEEALNETENGLGLVAKGTHQLILGDISNLPYTKILAIKKLLQPGVFFTAAKNITFSDWLDNNNNYSGLVKSLPTNVHLLTLEPWKGRSILLRLEHLFQSTDCSDEWCRPATVNIDELFNGLKVKSVRETNLVANQWKSETNRLKWQTKETADYESEDFTNNGPSVFMAKIPDRTFYITDNEMDMGRVHRSRRNKNFSVTISPSEIKTFIIEAEFK